MTADNFYRNVMISVGGHMVIVLLIMFRAVMMPAESIVIRNAIRVDVVGLPQKIKEPVEAPPAEKPAPAPAPAASAAPAPKVLPKKADPLPSLKPKVQENAHKKQTDAFRKMDQENAFDKLNEKTESKAKAKPKAAQYAGNTISHGSATEGLDQNKADEYYNVVNDSVHSHWVLPQWLADADYKAQVRVLIDERGYVIKKIWVKKSGNDVFDGKVDEAIDASSPLPAPPAGLRRGLASAGIGLNFP